MTDWLNVKGSTYSQYSFNADQRIFKLLETYPFVFDEVYWYWHPKTRKDLVKRAPLWTYPNKSIPKEKPKDPFQRKLTLETKRKS